MVSLNTLLCCVSSYTSYIRDFHQLVGTAQAVAPSNRYDIFMILWIVYKVFALSLNLLLIKIKLLIYPKRTLPHGVHDTCVGDLIFNQDII